VMGVTLVPRAAGAFIDFTSHEAAAASLRTLAATGLLAWMCERRR